MLKLCEIVTVRWNTVGVILMRIVDVYLDSNPINDVRVIWLRYIYLTGKVVLYTWKWINNRIKIKLSFKVYKIQNVIVSHML